MPTDLSQPVPLADIVEYAMERHLASNSRALWKPVMSCCAVYEAIDWLLQDMRFRCGCAQRAFDHLVTDMGLTEPFKVFDDIPLKDRQAVRYAWLSLVAIYARELGITV